MDQPANPDFKERERVAARVSAAFKARGYQLVQYGGATVEQFYKTEAQELMDGEDA